MLLVVVERDAGSVLPASLKALTAGRALAGELGTDVAAVAFGDGDEVAAQLAKYGVRRLQVLSHELFGDYSPEAWGAGLAQLVGQVRPAGVLAAGTERGNEVLAHAAARTRSPLAANCLSVSVADGAWELTRIRAGGLLLEDAELAADTKFVTVVPAGTEPTEADIAAEVEVSRFAAELDDLACSRIVDRTTRTEGVSLATARVVVSGGRGVGSAEGFAVLEELAGLLGGAVGCSRVATNNGWRPHSDQVGQTGTKVTPDLYIACGISGATQHWVGCMDAKAILAINSDPDAALVDRATYAVIGNLHDVLPAVVDEIRRRTPAS